MQIRALSVLLVMGSVSGAAIAGPDWIEDGDAGSTLIGAQDATSVGPLQTVAGTLGGEDREDVYKLVILDGDNVGGSVMFGLSMSTTGLFNPSLWLFDSAGFGVLGNDDDPILGGPDSRLTTPSTDGVTLLLPPGIYFLAITESGNVPLSFREGIGLGNGFYEEIFSFASSTEVSGPDGAGADNPLAAWSGGQGSSGGYGIEITPTPGSVGLFAIAGVGLTRRRR
ncbi:MAG: DVUA0089 family protein [Phycisphaerales bacterium]|nr:DVUA0089 family protein [Phycisphaerales bacterium]